MNVTVTGSCPVCNGLHKVTVLADELGGIPYMWQLDVSPWNHELVFAPDPLFVHQECARWANGNLAFLPGGN